MTDRLENGALAALLVLTLVIVGFSLRTGEPPAASVSAPTGLSPTAGTPSPSPSTANRTVVFLGDSFAEGEGATSAAKRWTTLLAGELGLEEVNLGHARTGYLRKGPEGSCGKEACKNFLDTVDDAVAAAPGTVVVTGGANDLSLPARQVDAAVRETLSELRKALPDAAIYVVNPWWDLRPVPDALATRTTAIRAAADDADVTWLDTGQPVAGKRALMDEESNDPNDQGHAALAAAVQKAIERATNG